MLWIVDVTLSFVLSTLRRDLSAITAFASSSVANVSFTTERSERPSCVAETIFPAAAVGVGVAVATGVGVGVAVAVFFATTTTG